MGSNFFMRDDRVVHEGRTGRIKDVDGPYCNIVWDDDPSREARTWVHYEQLEASDG